METKRFYIQSKFLWVVSFLLLFVLIGCKPSGRAPVTTENGEILLPPADSEITMLEIAGSNGDLTGNLRVTGFNGNSAVYTIPQTVNGKTVTEIGEEAFMGKGITSITIPGTVTHIGDRAFADTKLTRINIPGSVISIGIHAFAALEEDAPPGVLAEVFFSEGLEQISEGAFFNNSIKNINLPASLTQLGTGAFIKNRLTTLVLPSGINTIGDYCFAENQITQLTIPGNITSIGTGAFFKNRLITLVLPSELTTISDHCFSGNRITAVAFPESLRYIGSHAFFDNRLTELRIPDRVEYIGQSAFMGNRMSRLDIASRSVHIDNNAFTGNRIETITITAGNRIVDGAFTENPLYIFQVVKERYIFSNDFFFSAYNTNKRQEGTYKFDGRYWQRQE